eukprot:m.169407 g.169407  ORF g.169407 m.169407 type:complete len:349 (-) comp16668_c0_seq21:1368-2414(-)
MCAMATDETICQLARLAKEVVDKIKTEHVAHQHKTWKLFSKNSAVNTLQQLRNYSFEQATVAVQRIIDEGLFETIIPDSAILSGHPGDALRYRAAPCLRKLAETSSSVPVPSKFRPRQRRQHRQHEEHEQDTMVEQITQRQHQQAVYVEDVHHLATQILSLQERLAWQNKRRAVLAQSALLLKSQLGRVDMKIAALIASEDNCDDVKLQPDALLSSKRLLDASTTFQTRRRVSKHAWSEFRKDQIKAAEYGLKEALIDFENESLLIEENEQTATKLLDDHIQRAGESKLQRYLLPLAGKLGQVLVLALSVTLGFWLLLRRLFQSIGKRFRLVVAVIVATVILAVWLST